MPPALPQYLWMNGQLVPYQDATIHVSTAAAFYATNVFEGIRIYWNDDKQEAYAFRLQEHFMRRVRVDENDALLGAVCSRRSGGSTA